MKNKWPLVFFCMVLSWCSAVGADVVHGSVVSVGSDFVTLYEEYFEAAEQGDARAQINLGFMHEHGLGVSKNLSKALIWYNRAAEQGHAGAQLKLGDMYDKGLGVPKNYAVAADWYRRAAEQGLAFAQFDLGYMYSAGRGVVTNNVKAYKWFSLSAAQGNDRARQNLSDLESKMTIEQINQAQRLASEIFDQIQLRQ